MNKHTRGPWEIERTTRPEDDFQCRIISKNSGNDGCDIIVVGEVGKQNGRANIHYEPNARLIAAAPYLLNTLKDILGIYGDSLEVDIKTAIELAEGALK